MKYRKTSLLFFLAAAVGAASFYSGAPRAAIPGVGIEIPSEVMKVLLPLLAAFLPDLIAGLFPKIPGMADLVRKILSIFFPDLKPLKGSPSKSLIDRVSDIAVEFAEQGDDECVKCANHLHDLALKRMTDAHCETKAAPESVE